VRESKISHLRAPFGPTPADWHGGNAPTDAIVFGTASGPQVLYRQQNQPPSDDKMPAKLNTTQSNWLFGRDAQPKPR